MRRTFVGILLLEALCVVVVTLFFAGCALPGWKDPCYYGCSGGGQDSVTIHMPFDAGYVSQCVQGVGDAYSHSYSSTYYDLDFDTPNGVDDIVFAPAGGIVYVHDDPSHAFGIHVKVDLGDGTYILIAHLEQVFVSSGEEVAEGQILGFEGTTGSSTGDHVHIGRHEGDAAQDASFSTSVEGLMLHAEDTSTGTVAAYAVSDFVCDLSWGRSYASELQTARWHPNGSLIMTPSSSTVYVLEYGETRAFSSEAVFWSYGYDFADVALVSEEELACYNDGGMISSETEVRAVYDDGVVWLLLGSESDGDRISHRVQSESWQAVLKSWGITASTYDDLHADDDLGGALASYPAGDGYAQFRDGSLLTEASSSTVYVVGDGVAMPIFDWNAYLLMDFWDRSIIWLDDGAVAAVQDAVGDCGYGSYCIGISEVTRCGGVYGSYEAAAEEDPPEDDDEPEPEDIEDPPVDTEDTGDTGGDDDPIDTGGEIPPEDDDTDEPPDELPDDLAEGLDWIRADGDAVGLKVSEVFSGSVDGEDVAVVGEGNGGWGYSPSYLVRYDAATDMAWYDFSSGEYRVTWRTEDEWALYYTMCMSASDASDLCHENQDGTYSLCFAVAAGEVGQMSQADCQLLE